MGPALAGDMERHPEFLFDISLEWLVWKDNKKGWEMMKHMISFISLNKLNCPDDKLAFYFTQATQAQSWGFV